MKRILIASALALATAVLSLAAHAKTKLTFALVADPTHEVYIYALRKGLVTSDTVEIEFTTTSIPALTQALFGRRYDAIQVSSAAMPHAAAQGLKVNIIHAAIGRNTGPTLDFWVKPGSPLKTAADLKGKRIAVYGLAATNMTMMRIGLAKIHGFNVDLREGDITFVEVPAASIPATILSDRVDAGALLYTQAYDALKTGQFRSVFSAGPELRNRWGARPVLPVIVAFPERLEREPAVYREFNRMLKASITYAFKNQEEVTGAIGRQANVQPEFLAMFLRGVAEFDSHVSEDDIKAMNGYYADALSLGIIKAGFDARSIVWPEALKP